MPVVAHGVDIVEVARVAELIADHPERARERLFTDEELEYARGKKREIEHLAARFAAKEAVFKALGTGWAEGLAWTDVEVTRDHAGRPGLLLHNLAADRAQKLGIATWLVSLSHTETHAIASVIGVQETVAK